MPPLGPVSPCPGIETRLPSSTPEGIVTFIFCFFFARPDPPQSRQGFSMIEPSPLQLGQGCAMEKKPDERRTCPEPWQVGQTRFPAPSALPEPRQVLQESFLE